jgi:hypothetical protein
MVDFKKLGQQAKVLVDKRGGTDALKQDAEQLKSIAKGSGSFADKAKAAAEALKTPGGTGGQPVARERSTVSAGGDEPPNDPQPTPSEDPPDPQDIPDKHQDPDKEDPAHESRAERKAERRAERAGRRGAH